MISMYNWNKRKIKEYIKAIESRQNPPKSAIIDLELLKLMKSDMNKVITPTDNKDDYKLLSKYDTLIDSINYSFKDEVIEPIKYSTIKTSKKENTDILIETLLKIDKKLAGALSPFIFDKKYISYVKDNPYFVIYLRYFNHFYMSLGKNDDITDLTYYAHELFHILSAHMNPNFYYSIDNEFYPILGELIIANELSKNKTYNEESKKVEINNYYSFLSYLNILNDKINAYELNVIKDDGTSLFDTLSNVISYLIALELYMIYIKDKEKCFYISNRLIRSNTPLVYKLYNNNIELGKSKDELIKRLKKYGS